MGVTAFVMRAVQSVELFRPLISAVTMSTEEGAKEVELVLEIERYSFIHQITNSHLTIN